MSGPSAVGGTNSVASNIPSASSVQAKPLTAAEIETQRISQSVSGSVVSHLLGLSDLQHPVQAHRPRHNTVAIWAQALHNIKLGHILEGIEYTANFWFLVLFVCFFAWLYVVYWVRHHEPMSEQAIGTSSNSSTTSAADRQLVAGAKDAFPFKTSATMGNFYVPVPGSPENSAAGPAYADVMKKYDPSVQASTLPKLSAPATESVAPPPVLPMSNMWSSSMQPTQSSVLPGYDPSMAAPQSGTAFNVPVRTSAGTRLKMIVNR